MYLNELFKQLEGLWSISRKVRGPELEVTVIGDCYFHQPSKINSQLLSLENGELIIKNKEDGDLIANISKIYKYELGNTGISVYYLTSEKEYQLLHTLKFEPIQWNNNTYKYTTTAYLCGKDTYSTEYTFYSNMDRFEIKHIVKGPVKDYVSTTTFTRCR